MKLLDILEKRIDQSESLLVHSWKRAKQERGYSLDYPQNSSANFKISYSDYKVLLEDVMRLRLRSNRKNRSATDLDRQSKGLKNFSLEDNIGQTIIELKDKLNTSMDQKKFLQNSMENIMKRQAETENK